MSEHESNHDRCWCCLQPLSEHNLPVRLSPTITMPVCGRCWCEIPLAFRLEQAQKYAASVTEDASRATTADAMRAAASVLRELAESVRDHRRTLLHEASKRSMN